METTNVMYKSKINTPIGDMVACSTQKGICTLVFANEKRVDKIFEELKKESKVEFENGNNKYLTQLQNELEEYFEGTRKMFSVSLDMKGTDFRKSVWSELLKVPYGERRSYKEQALAMDKLTAIRAIASANGANKIEIIIPCHRIIGSNGSLTGYAGGLERKKWLLDFEINNID